MDRYRCICFSSKTGSIGQPYNVRKVIKSKIVEVAAENRDEAIAKAIAEMYTLGLEHVYVTKAERIEHAA